MRRAAESPNATRRPRGVSRTFLASSPAGNVVGETPVLVSRRGDALSSRDDVPLQPTAHGMCLVPAYEELYCSEYPCMVTIRCSAPSSKFHTKERVAVPLLDADGSFRSLHYVPGPSGRDGWVWCAASSGELVAVNVQTKKHLLVSDRAQLRHAGPVAVLGDVWSLSPIPGSLQQTSANDNHAKRHRVVISVSRGGVVGLWDSLTRTMFATLQMGPNPAERATLAQPLFPLDGHRRTIGRVEDRTPAGPPLRVKCCCSWSECGVAFVGVLLQTQTGGANGMMYVVDARRLSHTTCTPLRLPFDPDFIGADGCTLLCAGIITASFEPSRQCSDRGVLWFGTSSGAVGRIECGLSSGAGAEGPVESSHGVISLGVHDGLCHKVSSTGTQHVVSCGSDGRVAIIDALTLNVVQRVSLELGTVVQELCCIGETSRGTVTMLLGISDRTFRCMSLRRTAGGPWMPTPDGAARGSRASSSPLRNLEGQSPRRDPLTRMFHNPTSSPFGSPRRGLSSSATNSLSTQQLIYHCMTLLQDLRNLQEVEVDNRGEVIEAELEAREVLYQYWDYLCCGGRQHRLPHRLWFAQLQEADTRLYWHNELLLTFRGALLDCNHRWRYACAHREAHLSTLSMLEGEAHLRCSVVAEEERERGTLKEIVHRWHLIREMEQRQQQDATAHDLVLSRLETALMRLAQLEPEAAKTASLQGDVQRITSTLSAVTEACSELENLNSSLEVELRGCRMECRQAAFAHQVDQRRAFLDSEETSRSRIEAASLSGIAALLSTARREEGRMMADVLRQLHEERAHTTALQQHRFTLENVALNLQRDMRDAELASDGQRAAHRRLEEEVHSLQERLSEVTTRLGSSEDQRSVTELELLRVKSTAEQQRVRLEQSGTLAEDTFKTVLAQREKMQAMARAVDAVQECLENLVHLGEQTFDAGITEHRIFKARASIAHAEEDLIAIHQSESHRWVSLEENMANDWDNWLRHSNAAETQRLPRGGSAASDDGGGPETSAVVSNHLHSAFQSLLAASECIGPRWTDEVLIMDKSDYFQALRRALAVLSKVRSA